MIIRENATVVQRVIKDVICDCCGKSCKRGENSNYEYATLSARWGFDSKYDLEDWESHLCENCALKIKQYIEGIGGKIRKSMRI